MRCSSFYKHGHGKYVSRIHSCRVLEEEGGVQMAGKLRSTQGTASLQSKRNLAMKESK